MKLKMPRAKYITPTHIRIRRQLVSSRRGWGRRAVTDVVVLYLLLVEAPVAATCCTLEGITCSFFSSSHELSTPINSITAYVGCMVPPALFVSDLFHFPRQRTIWDLLGFFLGPHVVEIITDFLDPFFSVWWSLNTRGRTVLGSFYWLEREVNWRSWYLMGRNGKVLWGPFI